MGCHVKNISYYLVKRKYLSLLSIYFAIFAAFPVMHGGMRPYKWMTKKDVCPVKKEHDL